MRVLIMGLPGSGKTTLAEELTFKLEQLGKQVLWLNADQIRSLFNDWDFSEGGRLRQALRMRSLCNGSEDDLKIVDFVAPLQQMREIFNADFTIWVDTIDNSKYEDTNRIFEIPTKYNIRVTEQDAKRWAEIIIPQLLVESEDK